MNVTAIAIVAIACYAVVSIVDTIFKKRDNRAKNDMDNTNHALSSLQDDVTALKSRVETLEKIVTDDKYQLNKEFENLKK